MADKRYYENPYEDFSEHRDSSVINPTTKEIQEQFLDKIKTSSHRLLGILEDNLHAVSTKDSSVYTGTTGVAMLYFLLGEKENKQVYIQKSLSMLEAGIGKSRPGREVTFICGEAGPLAFGAVLYNKVNNKEKSSAYVQKVLAMLPQVKDLRTNLPDELLYGRVGYLFSMLYINKHIPHAIPDEAIKQVVEAVIISGKNLSQKERRKVPLMYEWYDEYYLGGAHGIAGIMYLLLQAKEYLTPEQLQLVRQTVDFLLSIRYPSGNFPSSLGSDRDRLVHWCHGAPGTVQMLIAAYNTFKDPQYLKAAETCGEVVWKRGVLHKGYGICHGVAGNAYTFLILYQQTGEVKHLYRACRFAEWCTTYNKNQERVPDRPFSLFEGLAGTVYFMKDIQDPLSAKFPAFTV